MWSGNKKQKDWFLNDNSWYFSITKNITSVILLLIQKNKYNVKRQRERERERDEFNVILKKVFTLLEWNLIFWCVSLIIWAQKWSFMNDLCEWFKFAINCLDLFYICYSSVKYKLYLTTARSW